MKLFFHFAVVGFSNVYLIGPEGPGEAILIDPGIFDVTLLRLIEEHGYYIKYILVTHAHEAHIHGIKTILKIYDAEIFASAYHILDLPCTNVSDGEILALGAFSVQVIGVPGHSNDSIVYRVENLLFTGDSLSAGSVGSTPNGWARVLLIDNIREKLLTLPESCIVLPGHGPPSTLRAERLINPSLRESV